MTDCQQSSAEEQRRGVLLIFLTLSFSKAAHPVGFLRFSEKVQLWPRVKFGAALRGGLEGPLKPSPPLEGVAWVGLQAALFASLRVISCWCSQLASSSVELELADDIEKKIMCENCNGLKILRISRKFYYGNFTK